MRVSAHSRRRFADLCASHGTVRRIADVFEAEGVMPVEDFDGRDLGQRRHEVARHEASLDLNDDGDNLRLLRVYAEALAEFDNGFDGLSDTGRALLNSLKRDGAVVDAQGQLVVPMVSAPTATVDLEDYRLLERPEVLRAHFKRIDAGLENDPPSAIGSCKELVESTCKLILDDYRHPHDRKDDLLVLYKKTAQVLQLNAESVPDSARGSQAAQRALRSLSATVQALAELRNELGLGHGHSTPSPALARHARLTVHLSRGLVEFLLDTWHVRRDASLTQ